MERFEVAGTPREMGLSTGEQLHDRIRAFVEMRFDAVRGYFSERGRPTIDGLLDVGAHSAEIARRWDPTGYSEHLGIAEAAGIDPIELYTATNMTDMRDAVLLDAPVPEFEGCTSALVPGSHTTNGHPLAGQNWDLNPPDVEYVVAIHRRPAEGPQTWSVTCTGCLSLIGINEHGLSLGTTNIKCHGSRPGVGYLSILHRALREPDVAGASAVVDSAPRAGAHTYWLADPDTQTEWEASPDALVARETVKGPVVRTNHCIAPHHVARQGEAPTDSSRARFARMNLLLSGGGLDVSGLRAAFADRNDGVLSINRYAEDEQGTATNAVFVAAPAVRKAWACRGPGDRGTWIELSFD